MNCGSLASNVRELGGFGAEQSLPLVEVADTNDTLPLILDDMQITEMFDGVRPMIW